MSVKNEVVENSELLRNSGFLVDVHFRKSGSAITISPKLLGLDVENNENLKTFFDDFMDNNKVNFLRKDVVRPVDRVTKAVHKQKRIMALGETKSYMTKEVLNDFKKYLEGKKAEYFKERDKIVQNYDEQVESFKADFETKLVSSTASSLDDIERKQLVDKVMRRIPTKEQYHDSFKVELSRTKITMVSEVEEEEQGEVLEDTQNTVFEIVGKSLSIAFSTANGLLDKMSKKGKLSPRSKTVFESVSRDLEKRNIFDNAMIKEVIDEFRRFKADGVSDEMIEEDCEILLSKIYCYTKDQGLETMLDLSESVLTAEELESVSYFVA